MSNTEESDASDLRALKKINEILCGKDKEDEQDEQGKQGKSESKPKSAYSVGWKLKEALKNIKPFDASGLQTHITGTNLTIPDGNQLVLGAWSKRIDWETLQKIKEAIDAEKQSGDAGGTGVGPVTHDMTDRDSRDLHRAIGEILESVDGMSSLAQEILCMLCSTAGNEMRSPGSTGKRMIKVSDPPVTPIGGGEFDDEDGARGMPEILGSMVAHSALVSNPDVVADDLKNDCVTLSVYGLSKALLKILEKRTNASARAKARAESEEKRTLRERITAELGSFGSDSDSDSDSDSGS